MKKTGIFFGAVFLLFFSKATYAQDYKMGLGVRFSSRSSLINHSVSFKYFFSESTAAEALFTFADPLAFGLLVARHKPVLGNGFTFFYGGGAYAGFSGDRRAGLHSVIGLDYKAPSIPFNLSLDWKPELTLTKEFSFEPAALGLSARFTFK